MKNPPKQSKPEAKAAKAPLKKRKEKVTDFVAWFEIPALDIERAVGFYSHMYDIKLEVQELGGYTMAVLPVTKGIGGAIVKGEGSIPSDRGPLVYLNGGKDLNNYLSRVADAGGRVILEKTFISKQHGYFALFIDSEGNRLALHSKK